MTVSEQCEKTLLAMKEEEKEVNVGKDVPIVMLCPYSIRTLAEFLQKHNEYKN